MANHLSALKRQRQNEKRNQKNTSHKSAIKTQVKKALKSIEEKDVNAAKANCQQAVAKIDSAVNKGILHRNTASRKISQLTKKINSLVS